MEAFDTIIGQGVKLQGNLTNQGAIQINGSVEGEIRSESMILIGQSAKVKGPLIAKIVEIMGEIEGTVTAEEKIEIQPKGRLLGDATTNNLIIKQGAIFIGRSEMPKNSAQNSKTESPKE
jgi:cytoskeletal protein CcmA (bactofilin family)